MKLMKSTISLLGATLCTAIMAGPAAALPKSMASLASNGTISLSANSGFSVAGELDAHYLTPPGGWRPYQFDTSLGLGAISVRPELTVTTPEIMLFPGTETCIPFIGCTTTPDITLPAQTFDLAPSISLSQPINIYDLSYTSDQLPLGEVFTFDFGTPLLDNAQTLDTLVQGQFETGATTVNEADVVPGPFSSNYYYSGVLQPNDNRILGNYTLDITGPGLLADIETALLDALNENTALLADMALEGLIASDPCGSLSIGQSVCNDSIAGLDSSDLQVTVNSIANFSSNFTLRKTASTVPAPATLSLFAFGMTLMAVITRRRSKRG